MDHFICVKPSLGWQVKIQEALSLKIIKLHNCIWGHAICKHGVWGCGHILVSNITPKGSQWFLNSATNWGWQLCATMMFDKASTFSAAMYIQWILLFLSNQALADRSKFKKHSQWGTLNYTTAYGVNQYANSKHGVYFGPISSLQSESNCCWIQPQNWGRQLIGLQQAEWIPSV